MRKVMQLDRRGWMLSIVVALFYELGAAQSPASFFPLHVGDVWQYRYLANGALAWTERIDSMFVDTSGIQFYQFKRLYHDINPYTVEGWYAIPDSVRVFDASPPPTPTGHWKLLYKLDARIGEAWLVDSSGPRVAQLVDSGSANLFGRTVTYKDIRYGYLNTSPDTIWWDIRSLANGFGLFYAELEPMGPVSLAGAIIDTVRWGFIVSVTEPHEDPRNFSLEPNFPNPFNPSTTIRFSIARPTRVTLEVLDVLGQRIQTLVDQDLQTGVHSVIWNAMNRASGVYFYRVRARESTVTRKMILQK